METFENEVDNYVLWNHTPHFSPFFIPRLIVDMASGMISLKFALQGIKFTAVSACATSNTDMMDAFNYIRLGKAKVFVTGVRKPHYSGIHWRVFSYENDVIKKRGSANSQSTL